MDRTLQNKIVPLSGQLLMTVCAMFTCEANIEMYILPMFVLRRLDCLLEVTKDAVVEEVRFQREEAGFTTLEAIALKDSSSYVFYNTSDWTTKKLPQTTVRFLMLFQRLFRWV